MLVWGKEAGYHYIYFEEYCIYGVMRAMAVYAMERKAFALTVLIESEIKGVH
jgi:hypothetical protein